MDSDKDKHYQTEQLEKRLTQLEKRIENLESQSSQILPVLKMLQSQLINLIKDNNKKA